MWSLQQGLETPATCNLQAASGVALLLVSSFSLQCVCSSGHLATADHLSAY